jgi:hypothetical protein
MGTKFQVKRSASSNGYWARDLSSGERVPRKLLVFLSTLSWACAQRTGTNRRVSMNIFMIAEDTDFSNQCSNSALSS